MARDEETVQTGLRRADAISTRKKLVAYNRIPYGIISKELDENAKNLLNDINEICGYYDIYKYGCDFATEGSNGDYQAANLHYMLSASLIDKEARFLFAEEPTVTIDPKGDAGKPTEQAARQLTNMSELVRAVLKSNNFEQQLLKAARDCFIGKRVAALVNFNEVDGVTLTFLPSTQFIYRTRIGNPNVLEKFVAFLLVQESSSLEAKRVFKKKYEMEIGTDGTPTVYLEETLFDGRGKVVEEVTARQPILLKEIPAAVILNDGLLGDDDGESEIALLESYESWYSKLSNADMDAERKTMNSIKYTVDMDNRSTKNLSSAPGSYWDLGSDQNLENPHPLVGTLESSMNYSEPLKTSLSRIKTMGYEQLDIPDVSLETMTGAITSGKALKAIYWPLIVRCKEKMKTWGPNLRKVIQFIIDGAMVYPKCCERYINDVITPVDYEVHIEQNTPLPEDEAEERQSDLAEVDAGAMSRKSYMQKWRGLTDDEVNEELQQIALEREIMENSFTGTASMGANDDNYGNGEITTEGQVQGEQQEQAQAAFERLNGSQLSSLIGIISRASAGQLTEGQAIRLMSSGLGMSTSDARAVLAGDIKDLL